MNYYPSIKTILFSSISIVPLSLSAKQVGIKVLGEIKGIANPQEWECTQGTKSHARQRTYHDDGRIATYDLNGTRRGYSYNTTQPHTLRNIHTLPNRASDVLFSFAWDAKGNMTAQNSQGITENVTSIDAGAWAEGVYVWKVICNDKLAEKGKWIKE